MPGKRLYNQSLQRTWFEEVINNNGLLLADWEGLVEARPIPLKLVGNSWFQGSYDNITYSNLVEDDHNFLRVTTDGGITWRVIELTPSGDSHPPLTLGVNTGGLALDVNNQVLSLNLSTSTTPGAMSPGQYIKLSALKFDYLDNLDTGFEIYKNYTDTGDDRTHYLRSLVAGSNVTLEYVGDTIRISSTTEAGTTSTGHNDGTLGVGVFDRTSGSVLEFRHIHSAGDILTVTLDDVLNNIALEVVESNINHNILENYVANEHIDHSTVSILTQEGIAGGGNLTATRTLTLSFDTLNQINSAPLETDLFAFYRVGDDLHHSVTYQNLLDGVTEVHNTIYVPLTTGVYTTNGLDGGGVLSNDVTISLAFNELPIVAYNSADYVPIWDVSNQVHAKVLLSDVVGQLAVNISAGAGMNFTTITSTGSVTLGTPSTLTESSINEATGTTHTHAIDLSTWELTDLGDVTDTPTTNYYLKWNGSAWVTDNPTVGATTPGLPLNSIQFNNNNTFGGNAGLLYDSTTNSIKLNDPTKLSALLLGNDVAQLYYDDYTLHLDNVSGYLGDAIMINSQLVSIGPYPNNNNEFLHIQPYNNIVTNVISVSGNLGSNILTLSQTGDLYLPLIDSVATDNVLYFDTITGKVTYGAKPVSNGGVQTLIADSLSGLMVNAGSTSSAATIELDQNDSKLATDVISSDDYIGFWDVSASLQKKTTVANLPGWNINLNGVLQESIKLGDTLNFADGNNINLIYSPLTNTLSFNMDNVQTEYSIIGTGVTGDKIKLLGDELSPGANKYYGTNSVGTKGYHILEASGATSWIELTDTIPSSFLGRAKNVPMVVDTEDALDLVETEELQTVLAKFTLLADVPATYAGAPDYYVRVKADGTGLYFSLT